MVVAVISDEHEEFNPQFADQDAALGGPITPANMVDRVRARTPDLILVAGDLGHHSTAIEYRGFWVSHPPQSHRRERAQP